MLDPPRALIVPRINDDRRRAQIRDVRVRILAVLILHGDVREETVLLDLVLRYDVSPNFLIRLQIVDD